MKHPIGILALVAASSVMGHHSLVNYDTTTPFRVKGTVVQLQAINPHSILFLEERTAEGQTRRWAVEGPSALQLARRNMQPIKPGSVIEVCGYLPKEPIVWQLANPDRGASSLSGRLLNGEVMTLADGKQESWGDYGVHKCFASNYQDQHSTK
jgi:hypothetical protein